MKLGLENIRTLLRALGDPQKRYLKVQVAGTNGKGSVCAFLDSVCNSCGVKTGTFTSPHLVSITERIRINGDLISEADFARLATKTRAAAQKLLEDGSIEYRPTFFEQITAIALTAFAEAEVAVAILETGLGGRLDATTAADAKIAVITRIDIDHQEYLGDTIEEIAGEKAAIIGPSTSEVVLGDQSPEVMQVLRKRCAEFGIQPLNDTPDAWLLTKNDDGTVTVRLLDAVTPPITLGLNGDHQIENAQTALWATQALERRGLFSNLDTDSRNAGIVEGLQNARHSGRLETQGRYLFDGAHNVGGAKALGRYLDSVSNGPMTMIFGAMRDKNVAGVLAELLPKISQVIFTKPANERALTAAELEKYLPEAGLRPEIVLTDTVAEAIQRADESDRDGIILVTGSLYLVGEVKKILNN